MLWPPRRAPPLSPRALTKGQSNHARLDQNRIAALKVKAELQEALIMYVRRQNRRGDARNRLTRGSLSLTEDGTASRPNQKVSAHRFFDEKCIKCKTTDCVAVCPVNCFYEGRTRAVSALRLEGTSNRAHCRAVASLQALTSRPLTLKSPRHYLDASAGVASLGDGPIVDGSDSAVGPKLTM